MVTKCKTNLSYSGTRRWEQYHTVLWTVLQCPMYNFLKLSFQNYSRFSEFVNSKYPSRAIIYSVLHNNRSTQSLSMVTVGRYGKCEISPLNFQRIFHWPLHGVFLTRFNDDLYNPEYSVLSEEVVNAVLERRWRRGYDQLLCSIPEFVWKTEESLRTNVILFENRTRYLQGTNQER
jgi:hypothetical protein